MQSSHLQRDGHEARQVGVGLRVGTEAEVVVGEVDEAGVDAVGWIQAGLEGGGVGAGDGVGVGGRIGRDPGPQEVRRDFPIGKVVFNQAAGGAVERIVRAAVDGDVVEHPQRHRQAGHRSADGGVGVGPDAIAAR